MSENEKTPTDENMLGIVRSEVIPWDAHFGPTEIKPGETAALQDMPQVLFRGKKMIAFADDDAALDDLHMQAFFVGKKSQMPMHVEPISFRRIAKGMTAQEICPGVGRGIENGFDTCEKALTLTVQVINRGSVPHVARLLIMGKAVK